MRPAALALLWLFIPVSAQAAPEAKSLGTFGKWEAFSYTDAGRAICYAAARPSKSEGAYKARGEVLLTVTHRPADKAFDVVSVVAGYQYLADSDVAVTIGSRKFALFTSGDRAWARDAATDKQIVQAITKGSALVTKGTSSRNTPTTDTFPLNGFSQAYKAINDACKKPAG
jgi:hypothetical protein